MTATTFNLPIRCAFIAAVFVAILAAGTAAFAQQGADSGEFSGKSASDAAAAAIAAPADADAPNGDEFFDPNRPVQERAPPPPLAEYDALPPGLMLSNGPAATGTPNGLATAADLAAQASANSAAPLNDQGYQSVHEADSRILTIEEIQPLFNAGKYADILPSLEALVSKNYAPAQELLGIMYENGQGVPADDKKALELLNAAAEQNQPLAQHHLGIIYYLGKGVEKDLARALMWLYVAITHYDKGMEKDRAILDRDNLIKLMTRRDAESARYMARQWLTKKGEAHLLELSEVPQVERETVVPPQAPATSPEQPAQAPAQTPVQTPVQTPAPAQQAAP